MPAWKNMLNGDPLPWLLEPDAEQPGVRYFALRDLTGRTEDDADVKKARQAIMSSGPVPKILAAQEPEGYWVKPGAGYSPKYTGTVWQIIYLAQLGADGRDPRVRKACEYVLSNSIASHGGFSFNGAPAGFVHCLGGNLGAALIDLGWLDDPRLQRALEWQARSITGDGVAPADTPDTAESYFTRHTSGPLFACGDNEGQQCAWGAIKAMLAFGRVPAPRRTPAIQAAIKESVGFLLSRDPAIADYPFGRGTEPSAIWFNLGYPLGFPGDVLQNVEALSLLGYAQDPRLTRALELVKSKQDAHGRWKLEHTYNGEMWADIEAKGQPSKWVTLRALRVLRAAYP